MTEPGFVPVVGLIGGVGSGKSTLARRLASARPGSASRLVVLDGDRIGHQALRAPEVKRRIRERFGEAVFDAAGDVARPALGRLVFGPAPEHQQARADLEAIVHPRIGAAFAEQIELARSDPTVDTVLLDAAVLLEAGWQNQCDAVVFVDAPLGQRLERVAASRGWNEEDLSLREASQLPIETKRRAADHVVDNSGPLDEAAARLQEVLDQIRRRSR